MALSLGRKNKNARLHKQVQEVAIIFDIGSASIGGALVKLIYPGKPEILYTSRKDINLGKNVNSKRLLLSMEKILKEVSLDIQKKGLTQIKKRGLFPKKIQNIYCTFSAPWYLSQTKVVTSRFNKPKTITSALIKEQTKKEEDDFLNTRSGKYAKSKKEELHILEHSVVQVKLNGYETTKPEGKTAKEIEMSIFMSMIPDVAAKTAFDAISSVFHSDNLHMHSFGLVSFSVLRSIFKDNKDFILLDISGEVTDVILVKDNVLVESTTFPFGKHKLARDLAKSLNTTKEEAISRIIIHGAGASEGVVVLGKTKKTISDLKERWNNDVRLALKDFSKDYAIPEQIFFLSDENVIPVFKYFLETDSVARYISPENPFVASGIDRSFFDKYIIYSKDVSKDPFLAIEAIFFNTAHELHD